MSVAPLPTPEPRAAFDSGAEVPPEYEVFCEGCGYSLVGIVTDRCPECGRAYDPNELPFARIPWLHRRRLGRWRAYWATVWMVVAHPRRFARELCRPVRISAADARLFRRVTLRVAVWSVLLTLVAVFFIMAGNDLRRISIIAAATMAFALVLYAVATATFLALGTDMPVFIWRGLPTRPPNELAPVHHYAAAPLALMPFVAVVTAVAVCVVRFNPGADDQMQIPAIVAGFASVGTVAILLWVLPIMLMRSATGCSSRRSWMLGVYLPLHWLLMFVMVVGACMLVAFLVDTFLRSYR